FLWFINNLALEKRAYLLGAMNVRYVMSFHPLKVPGLRFLRRTDQPSWLYEVERVTPRAYVVQHTEVETNPIEIMKNFSSSKFEPTSTVFVDQTLPRWQTRQFVATATI